LMDEYMHTEVEDTCPTPETTNHPLIDQCYCHEGEMYKGKYTPGLAKYYIQLLGTIDGQHYADPYDDHTNHCVWVNLLDRREVMERL